MSIMSNIASMTREDYETLLKQHDWTYEYSEDQRVYRKGYEERTKLRLLAALFDSKYEIWNRFAPSDKQIAQEPKGAKNV